MNTDNDETNIPASPSQANHSGDVEPVTPTPTTDANADPSTAGDKKPVSPIAKALKDELDRMTGSEPEAETEEDSPPTEENEEAAEPPEDSEGAKDAPAPEHQAEDDEADVRFDQRPEWRDCVKLGGNAIKPILRKMLGREEALKEQLKATSADAHVARELKEMTGGEQGLANMRHVVKVYVDDPEAAVPLLKKLVEDAENRAGLRVQDADINDMLETGRIDEEAAIELQKSRTALKQAKDRKQQEAIQSQTNAQLREIEASVNAWEKYIRDRDPDFGTITPDTDPKHGISVADQVFDALKMKWTLNPSMTAEEIVAEASRAHKIAKARLGKAVAPSKPILPKNNGASATARPVPKTREEAIKQNLRSFRYGE